MENINTGGKAGNLAAVMALLFNFKTVFIVQDQSALGQHDQLKTTCDLDKLSYGC